MPTCWLRASTVAAPKNTSTTIRARATSSAQSNGLCRKYRKTTEVNTTSTSTASTAPARYSVQRISAASQRPIGLRPALPKSR